MSGFCNVKGWKSLPPPVQDTNPLHFNPPGADDGVHLPTSLGWRAESPLTEN